MTIDTPSSSPGIFSTAQVPKAIDELFSYEKFLKGMQAFLPQEFYDYVMEAKNTIESSRDFQKHLIRPFLQLLIDISTEGLSASGLDQLDSEKKYLFISNHRDIGLDSAFLNAVLFDNGFTTCQIAIGDNLMKHRVAELVFKINKSFAVNRSGSPREIYQSSIALSNYIYKTITTHTDSVWIAQREGRAKDGNDRTQIGVLKMLSMSAESTLSEHYNELNIVPVAMSYEYDPCDALKTKEYISKLSNPEYKKTFEEDVHSILQGFRGQKGQVHVAFGNPIQFKNEERSKKADKLMMENLAFEIDRQIHDIYQLNPINFIAHDLVANTDRYSEHYMINEKEDISNRFDSIIGTFPPSQQMEAKSYLLGIYANPVINKL